MTDRTAGRLIWSLSGLILFLAVADVVLLISNHPVQRGMEALQPQILAIPGFATLGAVLAARRPRNPIGWLFLAVALGLAAKGFALEYAVRALATSPGSLPLGSFIAWLEQALGPVTTLPLPLLLLLFPDGRLPSRRWWPLVLALTFSTCFVTVACPSSPRSTSPGACGRFPTHSQPPPQPPGPVGWGHWYSKFSSLPFLRRPPRPFFVCAGRLGMSACSSSGSPT